MMDFVNVVDTEVKAKLQWWSEIPSDIKKSLYRDDVTSIDAMVDFALFRRGLESSAVKKAKEARLPDLGQAADYVGGGGEALAADANQAIDPACVQAKSVYELTLTSPVDDPYYLRDTVRKIVESKMTMCIKFEAALELTEKGMPHVHMCIWSGAKYLDASKLKKLYKYPIFHLSRVKNIDAFRAYIRKTLEDPKHKDYAAKKGIVQFWTTAQA